MQKTIQMIKGKLKVFNQEIVSLKIPKKVSRFSDFCFKNCSNLTHLQIPDSVIDIGNGCFFGCSSLSFVQISNSLSLIGDWCFRGCSSLTSLTIPNSVTFLGNQCFYECSSLKSILIPNSVTSIRSQCFYGCSSLISIIIPNCVTSLEDQCFCESTSYHSFAGTPQYISPEVYLGKGRGIKTDIWSLGEIVYKLATGNVPFYSKDIRRLSTLVINSDPDQLIIPFLKISVS
jgi:serine/threonine protein kinase